MKTCPDCGSTYLEALRSAGDVTKCFQCGWVGLTDDVPEDDDDTNSDDDDYE